MAQKRLMITGPIGVGKSTLLDRLVELGRTEGLRIGGILSLRMWDNSETVGYNMIDIDSGKTAPLALVGNRLDDLDVSKDDVAYFPPELFGGRICRYHFLESAFTQGNLLLDEINRRKDEFDVIAVDEIGFLELNGKGFSNSVSLLRDLENYSGLAVVVCRDFLASRVRELFTYRFDTIELKEENIGEKQSEIWRDFFNQLIK